MKYLSVCSGIEAATVAWHPLDWEPVGFSEIEPFPSAVLAHHYPNVTNFGDMTKYKEWDIGTDRFDLLVGGTPCQSFSVAGLRGGLNDHRGNLALTFCEIADHFDPDWIVWENVPGVLSDKTNAFGCLLAGLAGEDCELKPSGKRWSNAGCVFGPKRAIAWRILDAQYFGVAQRRRRVFVVASARDGFDPGKVLFERESLRRDTAPSREKGKDVTRSSAQCFEPRSPDGHARLIGDFAPTLNRMGGGQREPCVMTYSTPAIGNIVEDDVSSCISRNTGAGGETQNPAYVVNEIVGTLTARSVTSLGAPEVDGGMFLPVPKWPAEIAPTMNAHFGTKQGLEDQHALGGAGLFVNPSAVRRLTPVECERLQGFPDYYTNIPWRKKDESPDGPRYKALGNSMAVPCMHWIGRRISIVEDILRNK